MFNQLAEFEQPIVPGMDEGRKNDPPLSPVGPYGHGTNSLFNIVGTNDAVFSMMLMPMAGALDVIPVFQNDPTQDTSAGLFGGEMESFDSVLTGVTSGALDSFANQPTTDCADGPVGGLTKLCTFVNPFGRYRAGVREVSMYRAGQRQNVVDPLTLRLMNVPVMGELLGIPSTSPTAQQALANEISRRMWESAISFRRMFSPRVWTGSPANNVGERRDILGLETHINTGTHVDYSASAICRAADPDVKDFDYNAIGGTGRDIVEYMEMMDYYVWWNASREGFGSGNIDGWLFMRPETWRAISSVWPIRQYQSAMAQMARFAPQGQLLVTAPDALNDRNTFRANHTLPLNGHNYMIVEDDTMPFDTPNQTTRLRSGQYASDIVFIPRSVLGGVPVTFWEHFNHNNAQAMGIQQIAGGGFTFTTDGGLYRFYVNFKNGCMNMTYEFSPRLKVKTPQLAWRLKHVMTEPLQALRSWDPASDYFFDGGVTEQTTLRKYYTSWSPTTPVGPL